MKTAQHDPNEFSDYLSKVNILDSFGFLYGNPEDITNVGLAWDSSGNGLVYISGTNPEEGAREFLIEKLVLDHGKTQEEAATDIQSRSWVIRQKDMADIVQSDPRLASITVQFGEASESQGDKANKTDETGLIPGKGVLESMWITKKLTPKDYIPIMDSAGRSMWSAVQDDQGNVVVVPIVTKYEPKWDNATAYKNWDDAENYLNNEVGLRQWQALDPYVYGRGTIKSGSTNTLLGLSGIVRALDLLFS